MNYNERGEYIGPVDSVLEEWEDLPNGGRGKATSSYYKGELVRRDYHVVLPAVFAEGLTDLGV